MNFLAYKNKVYIKGPHAILPQKIMSNQDIIDWTQSSHQPSLISFSTGILSRHWVEEGQACSDLGFLAAESVLAQHENEKNRLTQLILATISGDYVSPPTSPLIQHRLGLSDIGTFDIGAACAGFVVGLHVAAALVQAGAGSALLIASEIRSKFLNKENFATSVLFADGAAACILSTKKEKAEFHLIASALFSDGEVGDLISVPAGGSRLPGSLANDKTQFFITVKENTALFVKAVEGMTDCARKFLNRLNITTDSINWLIPHQGNKHLLLAVAKQLEISPDKVINIVETTGNTSGASVGIALAQLRTHTNIKKGEKVLLVAAGGGGIAACALLEHN